MKVRIVLKGGSSSIAGDVVYGNLLELCGGLEVREKFVIIRRTPPEHGEVIVSKSAIGYIERAE